MRTCDLSRAIRQIRKVAFVENGESMTDGQLLESFLTRGEEAAFEAIVHRHGPMVLGVCQRLLHNTHDAEDAFQATFLVLIRKARSIMPREMVGHWLYGVAYRTALEARTLAYKRHTKEMERGQMANTQGQQQHEWSELQSLLDREITGLPKKYRMPIVLCDLEGKTRKEAAGLLHLPEGTLSTRLSRGRGLLAKRLTRRGLALTSASLAGALGQNAAATTVTASLVEVTVKAGAVFAAGQVLATGIISPTVLTLMKGVMKTMFLTKLKLATAVVFAVGLIGTANFMAYRSLAAAQQVIKKDGQDPPLINDPTRPSDQVLSNDGEKEDKEKKETNQSQFEKPDGSKEAKANDLPRGALPYWVSVTGDQEGKFLVASSLVTYATRYTKIKKDGEEIDAYYYEPDVKEYVQSFEPSEVRAFSVQGRPIDKEELRKLLAKKTLALASAEGRKVPAFYLRIIKEDTLVLVFSNSLVTPYSPPGVEPMLPKDVKVSESNGPPNGPAPFWVRASTDKEGKFIVGTPVVTYKTGTAKIKEDGKEKEVYYFDPVATENVMKFDSKDVQVFTVEGKAVDSKEVEKLLAGKKVLVLASSDGRKVDPFYLRIIKEGTLVLVIPKPEFANYQPLYGPLRGDGPTPPLTIQPSTNAYRPE